MVIEKSDIIIQTIEESLVRLNAFRPDIVFMIDHFRYEQKWLPDNVLFASWIQDPLPHVISRENTKLIGYKDFVLNLFFSWSTFKELGYPAEQVIDMPLLINDTLYKKYEISSQEYNDFHADVCIVSNSGYPQIGLDAIFTYLKDQGFEAVIVKALQEAYEDIYVRIFEDTMPYGLSSVDDILMTHFKNNGLNYSEEQLQSFNSKFNYDVVHRIYRSVPAEWIIQEGIDNVKIWGKEWVHHTELKHYAQGPAKNGEPLSRILNCSKIMVGTNHSSSTHPRIFEATLSNCLYIGPRIPEAYDMGNIREFLKDGEEIILYDGKNDLIEKIRFYLDNDDERKKVIERGKRKILDTLTYKKGMERFVDEVEIKLQRQLDSNVVY